MKKNKKANKNLKISKKAEKALMDDNMELGMELIWKGRIGEDACITFAPSKEEAVQKLEDCYQKELESGMELTVEQVTSEEERFNDWAEMAVKGLDKGMFKEWIYANYHVPDNNCTLAPDMLDGILDYAEGLNRREQFLFFRRMFPNFPQSILLKVHYGAEVK